MNLMEVFFEEVLVERKGVVIVASKLTLAKLPASLSMARDMLIDMEGLLVSAVCHGREKWQRR